MVAQQSTIQHAADFPINVGETERLLSTFGGAGLVAYGLSRRGLTGLVLALLGGGLLKRGLTGRCEMYRALNIDTAHQGNSARPSDYFERGVHIEQDITIDRSPERLYQFWRNFENLPRFMNNLESVQVKDQTTSHWVAKGPGGTRVEWDATIINEQENELIAWKSTPEADVANTGSVRFVPSPDGRGTQVKIRMEYLPPAGKVGDAIAKLLGRSPEQEVREDLQRFKALMESGEIPGPSSNNHTGKRGKRSKSKAAAAAQPTDTVQEASKESFPASDPPGWTSSNA